MPSSENRYVNFQDTAVRIPSGVRGRLITVHPWKHKGREDVPQNEWNVFEVTGELGSSQVHPYGPLGLLKERDDAPTSFPAGPYAAPQADPAGAVASGGGDTPLLRQIMSDMKGLADEVGIEVSEEDTRAMAQFIVNVHDGEPAALPTHLNPLKDRLEALAADPGKDADTTDEDAETGTDPVVTPTSDGTDGLPGDAQPDAVAEAEQTTPPAAADAEPPAPTPTPPAPTPRTPRKPDRGGGRGRQK